MERITLQHVQLYIALLSGFSKDANSVFYLDFASGELLQKELRALESPSLSYMEGYELPREPLHIHDIIKLLEKCRQVTPQTKTVPFTMDELDILRVFLKYLLRRVEAICHHAEKQQVHTDFQPAVISSAHMLSLPNIPYDSNGEYYPVLFINPSVVQFVLPYTAVYTTRGLFDSLTFVVPISLSCALVFVHASMHKYFYDGEVIKPEIIKDDYILKHVNENALYGELHSGAHYVAGATEELKRLAAILRRPSMQEGHFSSIS